MPDYPNLLETLGATEPWSVAELSVYIRDLFESDPTFQGIEVEGEISNFTRARSGHLYFTLKDADAQIKCVMWRSAADRLIFSPEEGDSVVLKGRVTVYEKGGTYQFYADRMRPVGRGDLALAFERLKAQLAEEGLFDGERKQPPPRWPRKIGIVTSLNAAALQDILNVLRRRYPICEVLIAPTLVQGDGAPARIIQALHWLDGRDDIDVILIARGGGSIEDLWAFNDEALAREIAAARHPIISGVGHEIDFTIADFVADMRAPTPSAAAELAVPDMAEIELGLQGIRHALKDRIDGLIADARYELDVRQRTLQLLSPQRQLDSNQQSLDLLTGRLDQSLRQKIEQGRYQWAVLDGRLNAVSPMATLERGYAIIRDPSGAILRTSEQVSVGQTLDIQLAQGQLNAEVTDVQTEETDE